MKELILVLAILSTGLSAGLLFGYSCSVNPGLGHLPDAEYISARQSINRSIQNPVFFVCFFGAFFLLPASAYLHYGQTAPLRFPLLAAAAIIYAVGVTGITLVRNVPLNEALDVFHLSASPEEISRQRAEFEIPWNKWHLVRTMASILAFLLTLIVSLNPFKTTGL